MTERVTTGIWIVDDEHRDAFVAAWSAFATWACERPGAGTLRLGRDANDTQRYVSFGTWESAEAAQGWKSDPDFRDHLSRVLRHVDEFHSTDLEVVSMRSQNNTVTAGAADVRTW